MGISNGLSVELRLYLVDWSSQIALPGSVETLSFVCARAAVSWRLRQTPTRRPPANRDTMTHEDDTEATGLPQGVRVAGWTRYHDYFHQLNADMQVRPCSVSGCGRAGLHLAPRTPATRCPIFDHRTLAPLRNADHRGPCSATPGRHCTCCLSGRGQASINRAAQLQRLREDRLGDLELRQAAGSH